MNLRQYRQPEVVQAAQIIAHDLTVDDTVIVSDVDGQSIRICSPGLSRGGLPPIGYWLILHPDGSASCISPSAFEIRWEAVRGPVLA